METQLLNSLTDRAPLYTSVIVVLLGAILFPKLFARDPLAVVPLFGSEIGDVSKQRAHFNQNAKSVYLKGYNKFKNTGAGLFRIVSLEKDPKLIVTPKFFEELRKLPDNVLSFDEAIRDSMESRFLRVPTEMSVKVAPHAIKADLTPALTRINPALSEEVDITVMKELPPCNDWTPVNINNKLLRIVAIVSGRIFIGPELCHKEEYIDAAINYTVELMTAQRALKKYNPIVRRFIGHYTPEVKALRKREQESNRFLAPVVQSRREAASRGEQKPDDMLTWLMDKAANLGMKDDTALAELQLALSFAAIHTTTMTTTNVCYQLATHPEYIQPLRDEIRQVLQDNGGVFAFRSLQDLKKLDSFIKETLRIQPLGFSSFQRKVTRPFTLSNGQYVPAGTTLEMPAYGISRDPTIFSDPDTFKGFRFSDLREQSGNSGAAKYQFVSVTRDVLTFGYGRHACPGRFFAANEIKMIVARMLLNFDIKMKDGEAGRSNNIEFGPSSIPDPTKELLFKRAAV